MSLTMCNWANIYCDASALSGLRKAEWLVSVMWWMVTVMVVVVVVVVVLVVVMSITVTRADVVSVCVQDHDTMVLPQWTNTVAAHMSFSASSVFYIYLLTFFLLTIVQWVTL